MRIARAGGAAAYAAALAFFCLKYVPLTGPFQAVFLPVLAGMAAVTWADRRAGTLALIALFPLVNGLPYFFGLYENVMHAPAALVLFLFFGLGRIGGWAFGTPRPAEEEGGDDRAKLDPAMGLERPLMLWAAVVVVSALITAARYANFFPVLSPGIYEWTVNRAGGRAGGAIMSVVLSALNHLTGIAFFLCAAPLLREEKFRRRALAALGGATLAALLFGLFQRLGHTALGNDRAGAALGLINGTFKDFLSFGTFLSLVVPLFAAVFLTAKKGALKIVAAGVVLLSLGIIAFTGSKSGIIALAVTSTIFAAVATGVRLGRRRFVSVAAAFLALAVLGGALVLSPRSGIGKRFAETGQYAVLRVKEMWAPAVRMMRAFPLSGIGEGGYIIEASNYSEFFAKRMAEAESAENLFIQVGAETGLVGLAALLWLAGAIAVRAWKGRRIVRGAGAKEGFGGLGGKLARFPRRGKLTPTLLLRSLTHRAKIQPDESGPCPLSPRTGFPPSPPSPPSPSSVPGSNFKKGSEEESSEANYLIYIGAALGLLAFFINALAHTYIGSFEIMYAFWFLAALAFALTGDRHGGFAGPVNEPIPDPRPKKRRFLLRGAVNMLHNPYCSPSTSRAAKTSGVNYIPPGLVYLGAATVLLFAASHLWNSTHSLSIAARSERFGLRQEFGLGAIEKTADGRFFRWSEGAAAVPIRVESPRLVLSLQAAHPDIVERPVWVRIEIMSPSFRNREAAAEVEFRDHSRHEAVLEAGRWAGRDALLLIRVSRTWSPKKMLGVSDARNLGIALGQIRSQGDQD
jgi:O-Antigen ligase